MRTIPEVVEAVLNILNEAERTEECNGDMLCDINELMGEILTINSTVTPCYLGSPCEYQTEDVNHNHGWIPCNERMPNKEEYLKDDGRFIVTDGNRVYQSIYDIYINQCFKTLQLNCLIDLGYQSNFEVDKRVIAWRPLPSPYEITI